ncbi:MAG: hypothetical protein ACW990_11365 [Promethearchaeota archaeon]|jgi:hypothetical protein
MSEEEKEKENSVENERQNLTELGLDNKWDILTSGDKKEKKSKEKKPFRGFN